MMGYYSIAATAWTAVSILNTTPITALTLPKLTHVSQQQSLHLSPISKLSPLPTSSATTSFSTARFSPSSSSTSTELFFWRKDSEANENENENVNENKVNVDEEKEVESVKKSRSFRIPFFASKARKEDSAKDASNTDASLDTTTTTNTMESSSTATSTSTPPTIPKVDKSDPISYAKELKRQAARARLEAEKMDAQLTLEKIETLETKLNRSKKENATETDLEEIQNQIQLLKTKLTGEPSPSSPKSSSSSSPSSSSSNADVATSTVDSTTAEEDNDISVATALPTVTTTTTTKPSIAQISEEELKNREEAFLKTPKFLQQLTAKSAGFDLDKTSNITAIIERMYMDEQEYLAATSIPDSSRDDFGAEVDLPPEELERMVEAFERLPNFIKVMTAQTAGVYEEGKEINATKVILSMEMMMDSDKAMNNGDGIKSIKIGNIDDIKGNEGSSPTFGNGLFTDPVQTMDEDARMIESLFPKSTRKEGETPTMVQMELLYSQVLDSKTFAASGKPELISGGYLVRGTNNKDNGDDLIKALDEKIAKTALEDRISVFYINDPSPVTEEQMEFGERPPVLFVTGPNVMKNRTPILTTLGSSLGFVGISFLSVYPFLLNDDIAARVDEQIQLATTSSGGADLDFLSDMTLPIFYLFIAIQLAHEAAHFVTSKIKGFDCALFPLWVPSPILGLTSSITALRSSPKNKTDLLDFALAGPLVGILLSVLAIFIGLELTVDLDSAAYNALPVLPVGFLMQSSLGGGIIEGVLGPDTLTGVSNPATATMHVHPFVVAGYASLLTNALSLTPFGRTDGGRISMALFGRSGAQLVGLITLLGLFVSGIFSSDALLLYFAFILFYQNELEIPCRNEADDVEFGRVILSILSGVLVLLTIIPM